MPTLLDQLGQSLSDAGLDGLLQTQLGNLGAVGTAVQGLVSHPPSSIGDFGAPFPRMFRPPYGLWDNLTLTLLKKYRMLMVLWTVDTSDYQMPGTQMMRVSW